MKIGVFDSGRGGEFIAEGLRKLLPEHEFIVVNDREHVPYGSREDSEIITLTTKAIQPLLEARCPIIVIACIPQRWQQSPPCAHNSPRQNLSVLSQW